MLSSLRRTSVPPFLINSQKLKLSPLSLSFVKCLISSQIEGLQLNSTLSVEVKVVSHCLAPSLASLVQFFIYTLYLSNNIHLIRMNVTLALNLWHVTDVCCGCSNCGDDEHRHGWIFRCSVFYIIDKVSL